MTKREAAIVSAYTEILIGDMNELYKYLEEKAGRPVYTHEVPAVRDKYRCLGWATASMCAAAKRGDEAAQEAWRKAQEENATEQDK